MEQIHSGKGLPYLGIEIPGLAEEVIIARDISGKSGGSLHIAHISTDALRN
jgi:hypothetical protein